MLFLILTMSLIVLVAAIVVVFVAYPHRGENLPVLPALGDAMSRAADAAPTLEPEEGDDHHFVTDRGEGSNRRAASG